MEQKTQIRISQDDLFELIYWARRYVDGRKTYAAGSFNHTLQRVYADNPFIKELDIFDNTLTDGGRYHPWAMDGDSNVDARPLEFRQ